MFYSLFPSGDLGLLMMSGAASALVGDAAEVSQEEPGDAGLSRRCCLWQPRSLMEDLLREV